MLFLKWVGALPAYSFLWLRSDSHYNSCSVVVWHLNRIDCVIFNSWGIFIVIGTLIKDWTVNPFLTLRSSYSEEVLWLLWTVVHHKKKRLKILDLNILSINLLPREFLGSDTKSLKLLLKIPFLSATSEDPSGLIKSDWLDLFRCRNFSHWCFRHCLSNYHQPQSYSSGLKNPLSTQEGASFVSPTRPGCCIVIFTGLGMWGYVRFILASSLCVSVACWGELFGEKMQKRALVLASR